MYFAELQIALADVHIWVFVECAEGNSSPVHHSRKSVLALDFADDFMLLIIDFDCISLCRESQMMVQMCCWWTSGGILLMLLIEW